MAEDNASMRLKYDQEVGAAYLRLREDTDDVRHAETFRPPGSPDGEDDLVLDFDADRYLVGIEFLRPELRLLPSVLSLRPNARANPQLSPGLRS